MVSPADTVFVVSMQTPPDVQGTVRPQEVHEVIRPRPFQGRKTPPDAAFVLHAEAFSQQMEEPRFYQERIIRSLASSSPLAVWNLASRSATFSFFFSSPLTS